MNETAEWLQGLSLLLGSHQTLAVLILIGANLLMGVLAALRDGAFTLAELGAILQKVVPYLGGYVVVGAAGQAQGGGVGQAVQWIATVLASAKFGTDTLASTTVLFRWRLPPWLARWVASRKVAATAPQT